MSNITSQGAPLCVRFFVGKDYLRKLEVEPGIEIYHLYPRLDAWIGRAFPDSVNPRSHEDEALKGKVPEAIEETLVENPNDFFLANRGETILAESVRYNPNEQTVEICLGNYSGDEPNHGIADGGTTDAVIYRVQKAVFDDLGIEIPGNKLDFSQLDTRLVPEYLRKARVHLEVIVGLQNRKRIKNLVQGRNTSKSVAPWSMANFEGDFKWIKDKLEAEDSKFKGRIGYEEYAQAEVTILDVLAIMTLFHKSYNEEDSAPTVAYSSIGRLDRKLVNKKTADGYRELAPVLTDLLDLHDYVYVNFPNAFDKAFPGSRIGARSKEGIKHFPRRDSKDPLTLPLTGASTCTEIRNGFIFPILSSLRALLSYKSESVRWIQDPKIFFDEHGYKLVKVIWTQFEQLNENANALGKSKSVYTETFTTARRILLEEMFASSL